MSPIRFIPPVEADHLEPLSLMLSSVWEDDPNFYRNEDLGNSHYDWQSSRIAVLGNDLVSHWGVWSYNTRVGSARLKTGGVGAVATRDDQRQQGLMTQTGRHALTAMRQNGYDLSILHGYTQNYARFGYVRAWTYTDFEVRTDTLPARQPLTLTPLDLNRDETAIELYNQTHATFTGTAVRPTYRNLSGRRTYSWRKESGELAGYVLVRQFAGEPVLHCLEVVGETDAALAALRQLAEQVSCERIILETLPVRHPLCVRLRQGTAKAMTHFESGNGWMVRTVNLAQALDKLRDELCARLARSAYVGWQGHLVMDDGRERVGLTISAEGIKLESPRESPHQVVGGNSVAQLLLGTKGPGDIAEAGSMMLAGDAAGLVEALFPEQHPSLAAWDQI